MRSSSSAPSPPGCRVSCASRGTSPSLAQLHRHGGENGELVIPQRHHFEDRQARLVYATFFALARLPDPAMQHELLGDLGARLDTFDEVIADRLEAFAERRLVVERENEPAVA